MELLERVLGVTQKCSQFWESEDLEISDETVMELSLLIDEIAFILGGQQHDRCNQVVTLSNLHTKLNQLLVLWVTKCARLSGQSISPASGRRRKYINIELVRCVGIVILIQL